MGHLAAGDGTERTGTTMRTADSNLRVFETRGWLRMCRLNRLSSRFLRSGPPLREQLYSLPRALAVLNGSLGERA